MFLIGFCIIWDLCLKYFYRKYKLYIVNKSKILIKYIFGEWWYYIVIWLEILFISKKFDINFLVYCFNNVLKF